MELCGPVGIARLPKPFEISGKSWFGTAWGIRNGEKRRRHELCTAVDGHSVNIYNAQTGRNAFSLAVPPQTRFAARPVSVRWTENEKILRQICFAFEDGGLCVRSVTFEEGTIRNKVGDYSIELPNAHHAIVYLDTLPGPKSTVVVQGDGTITMTNLQMTSRSSGQLRLSSTQQQIFILGACSLPPQVAQQTLLKSRKDIANGLPDDSLIVVAFGTRFVDGSTQPFLAAWSLSQAHTTATVTGDISADHLFEYDMSTMMTQNLDSLRPSDVSFGPRASTLDIRESQTILRFKLTGNLPTRLFDTAYWGHDSSHALPLSSTELLVSSPGSLQILDTKYETTRTSFNLSNWKIPGSGAVTESLELLSYFSQIRRALARKGSSIVAIDIRISADTTTNPTRRSRLADSVDHGSVPLRTETKHTHFRLSFAQQVEESQQSWSDQRDGYDKYLAEGDSSSFERTILEDLQSETQTHVATEALVDYVLTKLFSASDISLKMSLVVPDLVKWLSREGHLTHSRLRRALKQVHGGQVPIDLRRGEISGALYDADPSMEVLLTYLTHDQSNDLKELSYTLSFLITIAKSRNTKPTPTSQEEQFGSHALVALEQDQHELNILSLPSNLVEALKMCTNRLAEVDPISLATDLRDVFAGTDNLISLIQFLRQQLFRGGYSSLLLSTGASEQDQFRDLDTHTGYGPHRSSQSVPFEAILKILSACLDAIGPLQVVGTQADEFVETIIPELLSEVGLSAEYIEKSADLQGVLRETLRYSHSKESRIGRGVGKEAEKGLNRRLGAITTIYSESTEDEDVNGLAGVLPLSLRNEAVIDPIKTRKGGGQTSERSQRHMLSLGGKQKGRYSFERLIM